MKLGIPVFPQEGTRKPAPPARESLGVVPTESWRRREKLKRRSPCLCPPQTLWPAKASRAWSWTPAPWSSSSRTPLGRARAPTASWRTRGKRVVKRKSRLWSGRRWCWRTTTAASSRCRPQRLSPPPLASGCAGRRHRWHSCPQGWRRCSTSPSKTCPWPRRCPPAPPPPPPSSCQRTSCSSTRPRHFSITTSITSTTTNRSRTSPASSWGQPQPCRPWPPVTLWSQPQPWTLTAWKRTRSAAGWWTWPTWAWGWWTGLWWTALSGKAGAWGPQTWTSSRQGRRPHSNRSPWAPPSRAVTSCTCSTPPSAPPLPCPPTLCTWQSPPPPSPSPTASRRERRMRRPPEQASCWTRCSRRIPCISTTPAFCRPTILASSTRTPIDDVCQVWLMV